MLLVVLQAAALAVLVTQGTIFKRLRELGPAWWRELWGCPLCLGWWLGAAGAVLARRSSLELTLEMAWAVAATGALAGALALFYRRLVDWLDGNTP